MQKDLIPLFYPIQFSLACDKKYLGLLSSSIYFFGLMAGAIVFGSLADRIGRRPVLLATVFGQIIFGVSVAFAPNYVIFVILRFMVGFFTEVRFIDTKHC